MIRGEDGTRLGYRNVHVNTDQLMTWLQSYLTPSPVSMSASDRAGGDTTP